MLEAFRDYVNQIQLRAMQLLADAGLPTTWVEFRDEMILPAPEGIDSADWVFRWLDSFKGNPRLSRQVTLSPSVLLYCDSLRRCIDEDRAEEAADIALRLQMLVDQHKYFESQSRNRKGKSGSKNVTTRAIEFIMNIAPPGDSEIDRFRCYVGESIELYGVGIDVTLGDDDNSYMFVDQVTGERSKNRTNGSPYLSENAIRRQISRL